MIDRRTFTTLLAGGLAGPSLSAGLSWGQGMKKTVFFSSVGPDLTLYEIDVDGAALTKRNTVTLPANIQYAWAHPSRQYFYVVSSNGGPGVEGNRNFANAFRLDPASGALTPHGQPQPLPYRPIHTSVDNAGEYLLTAYNTPSSLTVHRIAADGTLGGKVEQPNKLETGFYAHQIRTTPDNSGVILVTRGNNAPGDNPQNPGSLKTFSFKGGVLTQLAAIQPGNGSEFGPRHIDFHPTQPWVYVSIESQNKLYVYRREAATGLTRDPIFIKETLADPKAPARQAVGTVHVHPNGRFVYVINRASSTVDFEGKKVFAGGENTVAVFSINEATGEPTLIQNIDGKGIQLRTFAIDPSARLLVAASITPLPTREGNSIGTLTAGISVMRIGGDGKLSFVRKYDVDTAKGQQFWSGMVTLA
ncbi:MAG TPA: beta-propeller fold lactonase family protein [Xanthobacteraceae bacterium]|jgi:6-phosphogluconolactonase (cycloisomerase 2 family)|nr:beta-propeller fold lactonase family protein [Xanthobacteraceae bacterium]